MQRFPEVVDMCLSPIMSLKGLVVVDERFQDTNSSVLYFSRRRGKSLSSLSREWRGLCSPSFFPRDPDRSLFGGGLVSLCLVALNVCCVTTQPRPRRR